LSWDALLRKGRIEQNLEIELLTDIDKYHFIETGIRGGISMVRKRYAKANNPLLLNYDASRLHKSITYLAANDLYGWAMSRPLPKKGFIWKQVLPKEEEVLKVDLEYPEELHAKDNSYPHMAPEKKAMAAGMMSFSRFRICYAN